MISTATAEKSTRANPAKDRGSEVRRQAGLPVKVRRQAGHRAGCRVKTRAGSARGFLCLLLLMLAPTLTAFAAPGQPLLKLEATIKYADQVRATAFSADESLIAAATGADGGTIIFNDRRSRAQLGQIGSEAGAPLRLVFSPDSSLLLVAGREALELWEVPIAPLSPGKDLPRSHLRWSVPVSGEAPLGSAGFGSAPGSIVWSAGRKIFTRATSAGSQISGKMAGLLGEDSGEPARLALPDAGGKIAAHRPGGKTITMFQLPDLTGAKKLEGHRFPVVSAQFDRQQALVSVDSGFNLIRWKADGQPGSILYLDPPQGMPAPVGARPLAAKYHLLFTGKGEDGGAVIVQTEKGKIRAVLKALDPAATSVSPTGRYIAAVKGKELRLMGFSQPVPAREYVKQLQARGAMAAARSYTNYLDQTGLPAHLKSRLAALVDRSPDKLGLEEFLASMDSAESEGNLENMIYWATKALDIEENHPQAMAAMARVADIREERIFSQARAALELGQHKQAIAMLSSQVPATSMRYGEALELIRKAEQQRALQSSLEQARDKLNLGDYAAARALVNAVLRKDEDLPTALSLQEEISDRSGSYNFEPLTFVFLAVLAMILLCGGMYRLRHALAPFLRRMSLIQAEPARSAGAAGAAGPGVETAARAAPAHGPSTAPRKDAYDKERRRHVLELLERTEEMIRLSRQADAVSQHSAYLLELEAETSAMHRRLGDANVDLPALNKRLDGILGRLRRLKFSKVITTAENHSEATYYDILKLTPQASVLEIRTAYHKLLKEYHPDLHRQSGFEWVKAEAEQMSKKLSEAYEVLNDSFRREHYDRTLPKRKGGKP